MGQTATFCAAKLWLLLKGMGLLGCSCAVSVPYCKCACVQRPCCLLGKGVGSLFWNESASSQY